MLDLTFGEQVKLILSRKGMTIKELAEIIEERTGKKMSRQNLTQRLGRDNFQEQDMRMIAEILECPFHLSILGDVRPEEERDSRQTAPTEAELTLLTRKRRNKKIPSERDITIGELMDIHQSLDELQESCREEEWSEAVEEMLEQAAGEPIQEILSVEVDQMAENENLSEQAAEALDSDIVVAEFPETAEEFSGAEMIEAQQKSVSRLGKKQRGSWRDFFQRRAKKDEAVPEQGEEKIEDEEKSPEETPVILESMEVQTEEWDTPVEEMEGREEERAFREDPEEEDLERGDVNPRTGHEYETNTVRMHPKRIGYVQVYDRSSHQWTDMTEWAFLGYQERKKALLGNDYEPPIYLD